MDNLAQLQSVLLQRIASHFGSDIPHVDLYQQQGVADGQFNTPAIILKTAAHEQGEESGDGTFPLMVSFGATCIFNNSEAAVEQKAELLAVELMILIDSLRIDQVDVSAPQQLKGIPTPLDEAIDGYTSWQVNWQQTLYLGDSFWSEESVLPGSAMVSMAPEIGAAHEADYEAVGEPQSGTDTGETDR